MRGPGFEATGARSWTPLADALVLLLALAPLLLIAALVFAPAQAVGAAAPVQAVVCYPVAR